MFKKGIFKKLIAISAISDKEIPFSAYAKSTREMAIGLTKKGIDNRLFNTNKKPSDWIKKFKFEWEGRDNHKPTYSLLSK